MRSPCRTDCQVRFRDATQTRDTPLGLRRPWSLGLGISLDLELGIWSFRAPARYWWEQGSKKIPRRPGRNGAAQLPHSPRRRRGLGRVARHKLHKPASCAFSIRLRPLNCSTIWAMLRSVVLTHLGHETRFEWRHRRGAVTVPAAGCPQRRQSSPADGAQLKRADMDMAVTGSLCHRRQVDRVLRTRFFRLPSVIAFGERDPPPPDFAAAL